VTAFGVAQPTPHIKWHSHESEGQAMGDAGIRKEKNERFELSKNLAKNRPPSGGPSEGPP